MPKPVLLLENFLPYRLSVLTNLVSTAIAGAYRERFGLSIPEWRVLAVLANSPDLSAAEVAQRTAMDKVAVSRAVRALLKTARLERRMAHTDRRRSVLRLTAAGRLVHAGSPPSRLPTSARSCGRSRARSAWRLIGLSTSSWGGLCRSGPSQKGKPVSLMYNLGLARE